MVHNLCWECPISKQKDEFSSSLIVLQLFSSYMYSSSTSCGYIYHLYPVVKVIACNKSHTVPSGLYFYYYR